MPQNQQSSPLLQTAIRHLTATIARSASLIFPLFFHFTLTPFEFFQSPGAIFRPYRSGWITVYDDTATHTHKHTCEHSKMPARVNPLAQSAQNGQRFELMWQCKHLTRSDPEVERRWLKRCHTLQGRRFAAGRLARLAKLSSSQLARQDSGTPSSTYTHTHTLVHTVTRVYCFDMFAQHLRFCLSTHFPRRLARERKRCFTCDIQNKGVSTWGRMAHTGEHTPTHTHAVTWTVRGNLNRTRGDTFWRCFGWLI